ncbi:MAG: hypothetical protein H0W73_10885 [Bacteroidetes bacterium]|nr:hypothetical protein [Bacteroidota bacterium]
MDLTRKEEYRNKKISVAVTALAFIVMVAFLIFKNIITSGPPSLVASTTNEITIGLSSENNNDPGEEQKSITPVSNVKQQSASEKIVTDANSETPVESSATTVANKYKRLTITPKTNNAQVLPFSPDHTGTETIPTADGNGKLGFDLEKRNLIITPTFDNDTKEEGKVIVEIAVDKEGRVIEANPNGRGTTTSNASLKAKAKKMAIATIFSPSSTIEEQRGTITITFSFK